MSAGNTGLSAREGPSERAQTAQDYAAGISIFLLTLAFVIGYFPTVLEPFGASAGAAESAIGNRVAEQVIEETATGEQPNELDPETAATYFSNNLSEQHVRSNLSVGNGTFLNVTVRTLNRSNVISVGASVPLQGGHPYDGAPAVTVSRIVTIEGYCPRGSRAACRLVVRVW